MRQRGWETWYTPEAVVTHFGGQSTSQVREAMLVALYRSKVRFFRVHRSRPAAVAVATMFVAVSHARRWLRRVLRLDPPGVPLTFTALWRENPIAEHSRPPD
jgi:GT2 family glycosyltransferase